ncbi:hypothetical protein BaRGS_00007179 [Batillaria attramentaria]|uniref:Uncharacterized protein n=1 Tax=Batillaria attramentaria TaxID=370345 RepID=A0ABD0LRH0_9CAEN
MAAVKASDGETDLHENELPGGVACWNWLLLDKIQFRNDRDRMTCDVHIYSATTWPAPTLTSTSFETFLKVSHPLDHTGRRQAGTN